MTFLIVAFCCHYFENGIKKESCMYDQYVLAASMSDLCYPLELLLFHNTPILKVFLFVGLGRWWQSIGGFSCNCLLLQKVLRRHEKFSFKCSRSFCEQCSFLCMILSYIENIKIPSFPFLWSQGKSFLFAHINNNVMDGSGTLCSQGVFPAANTHPVI